MARDPTAAHGSQADFPGLIPSVFLRVADHPLKIRYRKGDRQLTGTGEPERLTAVPVMQNFLPMLGIDPIWAGLSSGKNARAKTMPRLP
jgi:hypothetical protein